MPDPGLVTEKVRAYVDGLSPAARAMILRAARTSVDKGDADGAGRLVLSAFGDPSGPVASVQPVAGPVAAVAARPEAPAFAARSVRAWRDRLDDLLFAPIEPFTLDFVGPTKMTGRIHRASLERIRTWLMRDVAAADFAVAYAEDPGDDPLRTEAAVKRLRRVVVPRALEAMRVAEDAPKGWQRLVSQLGGDLVVADLRDILLVFQRDDEFADLMASLPSQITALDMEEPSAFLIAMRRIIDEVGLDIGFVATAILSRTAYPHLLALLAGRLAANMDARTIAPSRYGRLVDALISDLERRAALTRRDIELSTTRGGVFQELRNYHEIHRQTMYVLELDDVSGWHRRIGAVRKGFSEIIGPHVEAAAGLVRRSLRADGNGSAYAGRFDAATFEDAEFAVRLFMEARLCADSLALNEALGRARREIERTLELLTDKLLAELKSNSLSDRRELIDAVDGSIRLCRLVFGDDYATMMKKNKDIAKPAGRSVA